MHLYTVGDSYTHGDELADDPESGYCLDNSYRLAKSWPGRLSKFRDMELTNEGRGGASNDYCLRKMMKFTGDWLADGKNPSDLFVIIGWSHWNRREFYKPEEPTANEEYRYRKFIIPGTPERRVFLSSRMSSEECDFFDLYEQHFFAESHSTTLTLQHHISAQCYLAQMKIPYLFFNCAWHVTADCSPSAHLADLIDRRRFYGYDNVRLTFPTWTYDNGYRGRKPKGHPDEIAHNMWARHLSEYIMQKELLKPD